MKNKSIQENDIYVNITFDCKDNEVSEYRYNLSLYGNYELESLDEQEVREVISVLTAALAATGKKEGGAQ